MNTRRVCCVLASLIMITLTPVSAGAGDGFAGFWAGEIEVPSGFIELTIDLRQGDDGSWMAKIDVPSQGIRRVPMTGVTVEEGKANFTIPEVPGNPTFNGALSEDGTSLAGSFNQGGQATPFSLTRGEKPDNYDVDIYADYTGKGATGSGISGTWRGLIVAGPHKLRLVLRIESTGSGYDGVVENLDQGGGEVPIIDVVLADDGSVSFSIPEAQSTYRGSVSEDGSSISGNWDQAGTQFEVEFLRGGE